MFSKNKKYILNAFIIYILILIPSVFTPFQSDDYFYYLKGISLNKTFIHYMGWSGRIVTDTISSFLLSSFPYYLYEAINAFVFLLMCVLVSLLPNFILNKNRIEFSSLMLWLIFIVYWISNPNLGQTSFWMVGSANYLWTIMWASLYIFYYFYLSSLSNPISNYQYVYLFIFGFLAGCSNESTGVTVVAFSSTIFFIGNIKKTIACIGFFSVFLGCLVLIAAPGNFVRAARHLNWYNQSTVEQLKLHIFERVSDIFIIYGHAFLILFMLFLLIFFIKKKLEKSVLIYFLFFLGLSFFSIVILAKSPVIYPRSLNTGLFFLLYSISILFYFLYDHAKNRWVISIPIFWSVIFFIPSYIYFTFMMAQAKIQFEIREDLIVQQKNNGLRDIVIPDWYFTPLLKSTDTFDRYRSEAMPIYYGVSSILWQPATFNYAALRVGRKYEKNIGIVDNLYLNNIYEYISDPLSRKNRNSIVLELSGLLEEHIPRGKSDWELVLYDSNDKILSKIRSNNITEMSINNKTYININFFDFSKIKKISLY